MSDKRIHDLISSYLDQTLSETDARTLGQALRDSADTRRLFWEYARQHALTRELLLEGLVRHPALKFPATRPAVARRRWPALAAAASLLFATAAFLWLGRPPTRPPTEPLAVTQAEAPAWGVALHLPPAAIIEPASTRPLPAPGGPQPLYVGDVIRTGDRSGAILQTPDGSRIEISHRSTCTLAGELPARRVVRVSGEAAFQIARLSADHGFSVETDHAVVNVIGTRFTVVAHEESTRVNVLEGSIEAMNRRTGHATRVESGMFAILGKTRTVSGSQVETKGLTLDDYQDAEPLLAFDFESGRLDGWQWAIMAPRNDSWLALETGLGTSAVVRVETGVIKGTSSKALTVSLPAVDTQRVFVVLHVPIRANATSVEFDIQVSPIINYSLLIHNAATEAAREKRLYQDPNLGARLTRLTQANGGYHVRLEYFTTLDALGETFTEVKSFIDGQLNLHTRLYTTQFGRGFMLEKGSIQVDHFVVREMIPRRSTLETPR